MQLGTRWELGAEPPARLPAATIPRAFGPRARSRTSTATTRRRSGRLHDLGVMVNGSFVFGMDEDDPGVFDHTMGSAHRSTG